LFTYSALSSSPPFRVLSAALLGLFALSGCNTMPALYAHIDRELLAGRPTDAVSTLESHQSAFGGRSQVLYNMDLGMLQHIAGQYQASNKSLTLAEDLSEALYTRRITSEAEAFIANDTALPYEGEDFEKIMLNIMMMINYADLGLLDDALVEARKVDHKLSVLHDRNGGKMSYTKDPLARYLSGVLYEAVGDTNNALVAYRLAYDAFLQARGLYGTAIPDLLRADLLRLSEAMGLTSEYDEYRKQFPGVTWKPVSESTHLAELIVVTAEGRAPLKQDLFIDVPFSREALVMVLATHGVLQPADNGHRAAQSVLYGLTGRVVRIAVPKFVPRRSRVARSEAVIQNSDMRLAAPLTLMEDITAIAAKDLDERIVRTTIKSVARAAWKFALAEGVGVGVRRAFGRDRNTGDLVGFIAGAVAHMAAIGTEEADKRSWVMLPDRIQVGRILVPPGTYDIELQYRGRAGEPVATQAIRKVTVKAGEKRFVSTRQMQ
jgi:hypothetical protein